MLKMIYRVCNRPFFIPAGPTAAGAVRRSRVRRTAWKIRARENPGVGNRERTGRTCVPIRC